MYARSPRRKRPIGIQTFRDIREGGYYDADQYRADGRPIWLVGVAFSSATRHVVGWDVQPAPLLSIYPPTENPSLHRRIS